MAHAMAPGAKIDVIEVNDDASWPTNLLAGDALAAGLPGVSVVSNSWDLDEWSGETAYDSSTFITPSGHAGVTFLTSSYDNGANVYSSPPSDPAPSTGNNGYYPATSPNVVAVGGTQLTIASNAYGSETGWSFPAPASTVDNGSSSYTQTGTWTSQSGGFSGTYTTAVGGSFRLGGLDHRDHAREHGQGNGAIRDLDRERQQCHQCDLHDLRRHPGVRDHARDGCHRSDQELPPATLSAVRSSRNWEFSSRRFRQAAPAR